jgi:hypothetical protein
MAVTQNRAASILAIATNATLTEAEKHEAISAMVEPPAPGSQAHTFVWKVLIVGLVGLSALALAGLIVLALDDNAKTDLALTAFTTTFAGLIGLFVKSPTES